MEAVYWGTAALSLVAVWFNIKQRARCFAIWAVTNATWTVVDFMHGIYAQAALQLAYLGLSIYGLAKWRTWSTPEEETDGEDPT